MATVGSVNASSAAVCSGGSPVSTTDAPNPIYRMTPYEYPVTNTLPAIAMPIDVFVLPTVNGPSILPEGFVTETRLLPAG